MKKKPFLSNHLIPITSLPKELSYKDTVDTIYGQDICLIEQKLRHGLSVLVECDKQLTLYLYKALRQRLKTIDPLRCRLISGHRLPSEEQVAPTQNRMQRMLHELHEAVFSEHTQQVFVLPHLDLLTTTTQSGLNIETRETAALLYENPDSVFLAFKDPHFELPKVVENAFAVFVSLTGIPRNKLPLLLTQSEARKFGVTHIQPYRLYKYISGINAIRCRQIFEEIRKRIDFDPNNPKSADDIYREIREMTLISDMEIPNVDLHKDIGGYQDVKQQISTEILELLQKKETCTSSQEIHDLEEIIPKGIILHGPPGNGKTYIAKAIATALNATISIVSGPELKSKWVGESERNLRSVFAQARKSAPSIIVFDELDSFASARGTYTGSGVDHSMVNQLLTEMDGFRKEELVFVVGTTNFLDSIDPALLRPGRFELNIHIPYPSCEDRKDIFSIYQQNFNLDISKSLIDFLVQKTGGFVDRQRQLRFSCDHIYAIARALKRETIRMGTTSSPLCKEDIEQAIGLRSSQSVHLTPKEEKIIAVHEAGHAICAYILPHSPGLETVSIATGDQDALGVVMRSLRENKYVVSLQELLDDICVLLAGRIAETICLQTVTTGSSLDLKRASEIARMLVEELGHSASLGLRTFYPPLTNDHQISERVTISDQTAAQIDQEIQHILDEQSARAKKTLSSHDRQLNECVALLLEKKTIGHHHVEQLFKKTMPQTKSKKKRHKE